jgi:hypothetical protein
MSILDRFKLAFIEALPTYPEREAISRHIQSHIITRHIPSRHTILMDEEDEPILLDAYESRLYIGADTFDVFEDNINNASNIQELDGVIINLINRLQQMATGFIEPDPVTGIPTPSIIIALGRSRYNRMMRRIQRLLERLEDAIRRGGSRRRRVSRRPPR